jgi:DNA helicase-2/ATP-dependent DNA helicase PcrA
MSISALTERLLELCGLMTLYRDDANEERVDNIKDLISSMRQYEQINVNEAEVSLTKYLQDIALYSNIDRNEG